MAIHHGNHDLLTPFPQLILRSHPGSQSIMPVIVKGQGDNATSENQNMVSLYQYIHTKVPSSCTRNFQMHFRETKWLGLDSNFIKM